MGGEVASADGGARRTADSDRGCDSSAPPIVALHDWCGLAGRDRGTDRLKQRSVARRRPSSMTSSYDTHCAGTRSTSNAGGTRYGWHGDLPRIRRPRSARVWHASKPTPSVGQGRGRGNAWEHPGRSSPASRPGCASHAAPGMWRDRRKVDWDNQGGPAHGRGARAVAGAQRKDPTKV